MPRVFLLPLFVFLFFDASGQTALNSDSLWSIFRNETLGDTVRLRAVGEIAKYELTHDPIYALEVLKQEDSLARKLGNDKFMGQVSHIRGIIYKNQGRYSLAVQNYLECLDHWKKSKNDSGVAMCHQTIGNVYGRLNQTEKALMHYDSALTILTRLHQEATIGSLYNDMGNMYMDLNDTIALDYLRKSLAIRSKLKIEKGIAITSCNIAGVFIKRNMPDSALYYNEPFYAYASKYNRTALLISSLTSMGGAYNLKGDYARGRDSCLRALKLNDNLEQNPEGEQFACACLYESYLALGEYDKALEYYKRYVAAKDTLNNQGQRDEVTRLEYQFEYAHRVEADSLKAAQEMQVINTQAEGEKRLRYALFAGLALTLVFGGIMFNRFRITRRQKNLITRQQEETEFQKKLVELKNKEITDSINYAQRIQNALLPSESELKKSFGDLFVVFRPRDIVSGDFYWYDESRNNKVIAVADCTGHGVPGGFMSMLGFEILQDVVMLEEIVTTSEAMRRLDLKVTMTLNKNDKAYRDGMDMALCAFPKDKMELHFSGANRPLLHFSDGVMNVYKPDKHTIGGAIDNVEKDFTMQIIPLKKGDMIYLFTDGYADQFGGPDGKKFMSKNLQELLISVAHLDAETQKSKVEQAFNDWKGGLDQVDDVCVIGIRI